MMTKRVEKVRIGAANRAAWNSHVVGSTMAPDSRMNIWVER